MTRVNDNDETQTDLYCGEAVAADEVVPDDTEQSSLHPLQPVLRVVGEDQARLQTVPPVCTGGAWIRGGGGTDRSGRWRKHHRDADMHRKPIY